MLAIRSVVLAIALTQAGAAGAIETVIAGGVGSASANLWPIYVGINKGLFAAEDLKIDLVFSQANAGTIQQLAVDALNVSIASGLVDPIRAIEKGSPIAIVRFESQSPPYALVAKPNIKTFAELKGKTISLGGPKDITRIYVERMLAPSGVKPGEFDMVFAGATSARAQALLSGAVDAAILLPPFNFQATAQGFNELGLTVDFAPELPFSGTVVNNGWAKAHPALLSRVLAAHAKSVAWFYQDANRAEAVKMMVAVSSLKQDDVEKAYDFFRKGKFFEPTGKISRKKLGALVDALTSLGDIPQTDVNRLVLPGVAQMAD